MIGIALLAATLSVTPSPTDCMLKGRSPRITAEIQPAADVADVRVYFRRSGEVEPYAVQMALAQGVFEARLPKPNDTGLLLYFIEVVGQDGSVRRTPEMQATVVSKVTACPAGATIAQDVDADDVIVLSRGSKKPKGFGGIAQVVPIERGSAQPPAAATPMMTAPAPTAERVVRPRPTPAAPSRSVAAEPAPERAAAVQSVAPPPAPIQGTGQGDDYRVGPGDILKVMVYGHDDLTQVVTVQTDGTFTFPLIGRVVASGVTLRDLQRSLVTALGKSYVRNPQVTVVVQEYHSQSVFVVGEVARPGTYALEGETTVVEILAKAGPTASAGHEVVIVRPLSAVNGPMLPTEVDASGATAEVIRVNVREIRMGKLDQNVLLRPRDTIFVSEAAKVFVSGEVKSGGAFTFNPGMTVRQAISMAGGFTPEASSGRVRVVRAVDGKMREVKVKLDEPVQAGDTVVVKSKLF
jgi:polysaccharide biosynthesis/export protein